MPTSKKRPSFEHFFTFRSYGVSIAVHSNERRFLRRLRSELRRAIGENISSFEVRDPDFEFSIRLGPNDSCNIYRNDVLVGANIGSEAIVARSAAELKLTIAEFAKGYVFVHAGAVGWKGKGIIIPARSFKGKSTLTVELVRLGARYYSDEYAVLNKRGLLRPLSNDLSIRDGTDPYTQTHRTIESIGGKPGKRSIPVRLIVLTEFDEKGTWNPKRIPPGTAALEMLKNTVPIRSNPRFVMPILTGVSAGAVAVRSVRGDSEVVAPMILDLV